MSFLTGTVTELIYASRVAGAAKGTFTSEVAINDEATMGLRAHIPPDFWRNSNDGRGRGIMVIANGILSSTATPTYQFTLRLGTTGNTSAVVALGSAALTTGSGVTNQIWEFRGQFFMDSIGTTAATATGQGQGLFTSPGTANKIDPIWGGGATPGTFSTLDTTITNFFNFNVTCSASSGSNTVTLQQLVILGLN